MRELPKTEPAAAGPVQRVRRGPVATHDREVPAADLERDVHVVEAREREEGVVRWWETFRAADRVVEPLCGDRRRQDEWDVDVKQDRLVL